MKDAKLVDHLTTAKQLAACAPHDVIAEVMKDFRSHCVNVTKDGTGVSVMVYGNDRPVAKFSLTPVRGNASILVFHDAEIEEKLRGKGLGTAFHAVRLEWAARYKASVVMCTVLDGNAAEHAILRRFEWIAGASTRNPQTGNHYTIYTRFVDYQDTV